MRHLLERLYNIACFNSNLTSASDGPGLPYLQIFENPKPNKHRNNMSAYSMLVN